MAKAKTSEVLRISGRLSYPKLFKPEAYSEGQEKKFQATILADPSDAKEAAQIKAIKAAAAKLLKEAFGEDFKPSGLKGICFGDGNKKTKEDGSISEGYKDRFYITLSNTVRPAVANRKGEPVAEGDPQCPYAGCFVNATLTLWTQNNSFGKRINGNLRGVQFVRDGEAFGAAPVSVEDEFEALEDNAPALEGSSDFDDDIPF